MQNSQRQIQKQANQLKSYGKSLSLNITAPILGLGGLAVKSAADMETLKTSLDTVFQGNKTASNSAFQQIKEFAATTPFQLDEVATAFIKLKNLGLDPSISSLTSYGNTASALGKSLDQMIEAVADASVGEFERLKEFGIKAKSQGDNVAFTFQGITTTVGKNSAEISAYLQNIGNVNFAGSIERQANTFTGKLSTLKDNLTQAFAGIGEIIIDYISPLFEKLNGILKSFQDLSPTTKKWIVVLGGIAAAIGPLLALAGTILPAIGTGLALLASPIGLVIGLLTAVGVVIYKNWAPIKKTLIDIANYFVDLYNESTVFRIAVEGVVLSFKNLFEIGKFAFEGLKSLLGGFVDQFVAGFKSLGKIIKAVFTGNIGALPAIVKEAVTETSKGFSGMTDNLGKDWDNLLTGIKTNTNNALEAITTRKKLAYIKENVDASAITEAVSEATQLGLAKGAEAGVSGRAKIDGVDGASAGFSKLPGTDLVGLTGDLPAQIEPANEALIAFQDRLLDFQEASAGILTNISTGFVEGFAGIVAGVANGTASFGDVGGLLLSTLGDLATQIGKAAIKIGITMKAVKLSFSNPLTAIAAGAGLIVVGSLLKSLAGKFGGGNVQAFADGGIVGGTSFYGDKILARVNSGELILNQNQQRGLYGMLSGNDFETTTTTRQVIEGDKLILVTERAKKRKERIGS